MWRDAVELKQVGPDNQKHMGVSKWWAPKSTSFVLKMDHFFFVNWVIPLFGTNIVKPLHIKHIYVC